MSTPKIKVTYFDIEGRGEPVRLALTLAGVDFEDDRIKFPQWAELKPKTPNGKLPVMTVDDGPMRAQSGAMTRWVGSKLSKTLYPVDKIFEVEEALGLIDDLSASFVPGLYMGMRPETYGYPVGYSKTDEGKAKVKEVREKWATESLPTFLKSISDMLEKNGGTWLAGGTEPTVADCHAIPVLRNLTKGHVDHVPTTCLDAHPKVVEYVKRFCALEPIKGRYTSGLKED